jgi:hypothetical protein
MDARQFAILNSLVTFAAENVPGGLTPEEQEVARVVGFAASNYDKIEAVDNVRRLGVRGRVDSGQPE